VLAQQTKPETSLTAQPVGMPWRETCPMQQRKQFLVAWISHEISRTTLCQLFGISRQTGYKWVTRYEQDRSLEERSRRPKTSPTTTPSKLVKLILSQRQQFPCGGPCRSGSGS
jgi:putative transposase